MTTFFSFLRAAATVGDELFALATFFRGDLGVFFAMTRLTADFELFFTAFFFTAARLAFFFGAALSGFFFATTRFVVAFALFLTAFVFAEVLTVPGFRLVDVFRLVTTRIAFFANSTSSLCGENKYHIPIESALILPRDGASVFLVDRA